MIRHFITVVILLLIIEVAYAHDKGDLLAPPSSKLGLLRYENNIAEDLPLWAKVTAISSTAILLPAMTILGALVANPQWSLITEIGNNKSRLSYVDHTTSQSTIPMTALFAFLGTVPLWGLLLGEGLL